MTRYHLVAAVACGAIASFAGTAARADDLKPGDERFKFVAGWFLPAFNTDVRIDNAGDSGDRVDLKDDLGVNRDQSGALFGFEWRFKERHRIAATYSSFSQTKTRVIDRQITIGDEIYPVDATIRTNWSLDMIPITYSYSFIKNDTNELAGTFGIHWDSVSLKLNGSSSLSNDDLNAEAKSSADLPLPMFGVRYDHHFSNSWSAGAGAGFFSISFGDTGTDAKGSLYNLRAYTEYRFGGRYGAGFAIDAFKLKVEAKKTHLTGEYKYDYWGPQLYLTARF
jgi:hypothetical protein